MVFRNPSINFKKQGWRGEKEEVPPARSMFTNPTAQKVAAQSGGHNQLNRPLRIVVNRDKDVARIVCKLISPKSIKSLCKSVKVKRKRERVK